MIGRSIVLAIGPSSSAYTAASDLVIDQDTFLDFLVSDDTRSASASAQRAAEATSVTISSEARRDQIAALVRDLVARSASAVPMASVAHAIRHRYPDIARGWAGQNSFSAMLDQLDLSGLKREKKEPGYIYDPSRHESPRYEATKVDPASPDDLALRQAMRELLFDANGSADALESPNPVMRDLARRVSDLTDIPFLAPDAYAELFSILAAEINDSGFQVNRVSRAVRDECQRRGWPITRHAVNFIMQGIAFAGHRFGKTTEVDKELARAFFRNALNLCARNQLYLTRDEELLMLKWLVGSEQIVAANGENDDQPESL